MVAYKKSELHKMHWLTGRYDVPIPVHVYLYLLEVCMDKYGVYHVNRDVYIVAFSLTSCEL